MYYVLWVLVSIPLISGALYSLSLCLRRQYEQKMKSLIEIENYNEIFTGSFSGTQNVIRSLLMVALLATLWLFEKFFGSLLGFFTESVTLFQFLVIVIVIQFIFLLAQYLKMFFLFYSADSFQSVLQGNLFQGYQYSVLQTRSEILSVAIVACVIGALFPSIVSIAWVFAMLFLLLQSYTLLQKQK